MIANFRKTFGLALLATLAADQLSKWWVVYGMGMIERPPVVVTEFFSLVMVWNKGVSFGMLSRSEHDWSAYALVVMALVISWLLYRAARKATLTLEIISYGMIIGGALGNAIDRVRVGAVADFLYFHLGELGWPAFNVADASICIGVGLLLLQMIKNPKVAA